MADKMARRPAAIIFDFDETLADTFEARFQGLSLAVERHLGRHLARVEAVDLVRRFSNVESIARHLASEEPIVKRMAETYRDYIYVEGRRVVRPFSV